MTEQEIFNIVKNHLLQQNVRCVIYSSVDPDITQCMYRGLNGWKCAIGILITDEEYTDDMEYHDVKGLDDDDLLPSRLKTFLPLLRDLQQVHDDFEPIVWSMALDTVADNHSLER